MTEPTSPAETTRPAWPLFVLAALSFTPILGFFVGAVGASWALMSSRKRALRAAVISGTGALLNLAGMIVFSATTLTNNPVTDAALARAAHEDLLTLTEALDEHHAETGEYPPSLQSLQRALMPLQIVNIYDQSGGVFRLPRAYQYSVAGDGASFDLFAVGPDGEPGTPDDIRPELPDSVRTRSGYRPVPRG
jgi:hypothetical protein